MSKNKSQIYLKAEKQWVSVSEEFHKAYFREIDLFRRKQIRHGFCKCSGSKWWLCDMDCGSCEFQCANSKYISLPQFTAAVNRIKAVIYTIFPTNVCVVYSPK